MTVGVHRDLNRAVPHLFFHVGQRCSILNQQASERVPQVMEAICGKPVDLSTCKTDGDGKAVHAECLTAQVKRKPATVR